MKPLFCAAVGAILLAFAPVALAQVAISALPSGTTPLTGAEISPIVQSSTTVKVPASAFANMPTVAYSGLTFNKITVTAPAAGATLTILNGKTLTVDKSLEFDGTDSTKMTFPATSATIARTDAAQSFTGSQTFLGQMLTGAGLPTIANGTCGAAANGAVVAGSTNQSGAITIGAAATASCTVAFSAALGAAPKNCIIQPQNAAAAAVGTTVAYISSITTAHFVITGTALANANYGFTCL